MLQVQAFGPDPLRCELIGNPIPYKIEGACTLLQVQALGPDPLRFELIGDPIAYKMKDACEIVAVCDDGVCV